MMEKIKPSRLAKALLETADDMRRVGVMDDATQQNIMQRHSDAERHERLVKALAKGEKGKGIPYSRELMDRIADEARKKMGSDEPMDPDVVGD